MADRSLWSYCIQARERETVLMSKILTKNITKYKSLSLSGSLSLCLTLSSYARGRRYSCRKIWQSTNCCKTEIWQSTKIEKQHPSLFLFFRRGGVTLDETCTFIHSLEALTDIIVIILISVFLPSTPYLTFKWDFSHIFMCWTKDPHFITEKNDGKMAKKEPKVPSPTRY